MLNSLSEHGFKSVSGYGKRIPECVSLLKKQTWNTNRAICVVELNVLPKDMRTYLKGLRTRVAFRVGFFPLFWGLGLQVVVVCPGIKSLEQDPVDFVAKVDNQWAIIQSVFLVDPGDRSFREGRTWGQFLTGKYQDAISNELRVSYGKAGT